MSIVIHRTHNLNELTKEMKVTEKYNKENALRLCVLWMTSVVFGLSIFGFTVAWKKPILCELVEFWWFGCIMDGIDQNQNEYDVCKLKNMQAEMKDVVRKDMQEYLDSLNLEPDDPALILSWDWPGLQKFAAFANANANVLPQPNVQIRNIGQITAVSLKEDVVTHIRLIAQNRFRQPYQYSDILLAPNDPVQSLHLAANMSEFVSDPFVTSVIRLNAGPLAGPIKFGRLSILMDKQSLTSAIDFDLSPDDQFCPFTR